MYIILGFILGVIMARFGYQLKYKNGTLKVDETRDDTDYYTIYVDNLERLARRKYLLLKIERTTRK